MPGCRSGATLAIDDSTGQVSRERYLPFGQRRGGDDLPFTDRGFLGKTEDASTGLDYLSARYYDPAIGKFVSTDPLLDVSKPQWTNPYSDAGNNPVGTSDPTGLRPIDESKDAVDVCYKPKSQACKQYRKRQAEVDAKIAQAEVDRQLKALMDAVLAIGKIIADELGITDGIKCFTSGDVAACGSTAINVLSSLAGGMVGKLAVKYGLPWKWKKAYEIGKKVVQKASDAINAFKNWLKARDRLKAASNRLQAAIRECNSFAPGTKVVLADGTSKPIEQIRTGDQVLATDPQTGKTEAKPVIAIITGVGGPPRESWRLRFLRICE
ncbi:RHS repeat-associated core domain-containing protein [Nonomuraea fuscirosea]|uniref:RHS repeat-associated core domain-containing protein n=1 Tax=Nonomuraea fuscirosea TaxID=1291556 RepID=UPI003445992C